jgi:hypothetical protein
MIVKKKVKSSARNPKEETLLVEEDFESLKE